MKTMTCKELGGACDEAFQADTFEQMAHLSKEHGMAMFAEKDEAHLNAMEMMRQMMQTPGAMEKWFAEKEQAFNALPDDA